MLQSSFGAVEINIIQLVYYNTWFCYDDVLVALTRVLLFFC